MINLFSHRLGNVTFFSALMVLCALTIAGPAAAQSRIVTISDESKHAGEFIVPINKSQILQLDVPFADALVGNAEIADVLPLTDRSVYVLGKSLGSTSLTIYGRNHSLIAVVDLIVSHDMDSLKARLYELMPDENIEVRAINTGVVLSGTVSNAVRARRAVTIAEQFAGGDGQVTNMLSVKGSQQVMLSVRFSEVNRSVTKNLGFNLAAFGNDFALITGSGFTGGLAALLAGDLGLDTQATTVPTTFGVGLGRQSLSGGDVTLAGAFDALEQKGLLKTLAEPNLVALSGDTASFLAGGEFPIPVSQSNTDSITVEFKQFGVSLAFTPTVLEDGLINLIVSPEVSDIDRTPVAPDVQTAGFSIPSLITRRATTTLELRDGQSFAMAGMLQSSFTDNIDQFPMLGDLPVLGALFRSTDYLRDETELVILVTVRLVEPAPAGSLATPVDNFVMPSDADLFLFGRLEAPESGVGPLGTGAGGIDGSYGHIIK